MAHYSSCAMECSRCTHETTTCRRSKDDTANIHPATQATFYGLLYSANSHAVQPITPPACSGLRLPSLPTFYTCSRLGEFTVQSLSAFTTTLHVKKSDMRTDEDRANNQVTVFALPRTKTSPCGEDVSLARQLDETDPIAALDKPLSSEQPIVSLRPFLLSLWHLSSSTHKVPLLSTIKILASTQALKLPCTDIVSALEQHSSTSSRCFIRNC